MHETLCPERQEATTIIDVDFLYWEDCPSHERALELLNEVIEREGVDANVRIVKVETDEDAERLQFPGSPTIRVAGRDIDETPGAYIGLTCRVYFTESGKMSPLPSRDKIAAAFRQALEEEAA